MQSNNVVMMYWISQLGPIFIVMLFFTIIYNSFYYLNMHFYVGILTIDFLISNLRVFFTISINNVPIDE